MMRQSGPCYRLDPITLRSRPQSFNVTLVNREPTPTPTHPHPLTSLRPRRQQYRQEPKPPFYLPTPTLSHVLPLLFPLTRTPPYLWQHPTKCRSYPRVRTKTSVLAFCSSRRAWFSSQSREECKKASSSNEVRIHPFFCLGNSAHWWHRVDEHQRTA